MLADPRHVRSFPGGCGDTKMGSNYAPTLRVQQVVFFALVRLAIVFQEAMKQGCDQVLWLHGRNLQISEVRMIFALMEMVARWAR